MRGSPSRGINRGLLTFTRPVFPSPAPPGWNRQRFGFPRASHPAVTSSARRGRGQAIEHGPGTTAQLTSVDLQSGSSLNACDLASHGDKEGPSESEPRDVSPHESGALAPSRRGALPVHAADAKQVFRADSAVDDWSTTRRCARLANTRCPRSTDEASASMRSRYLAAGAATAAIAAWARLLSVAPPGYCESCGGLSLALSCSPGSCAW